MRKKPRRVRGASRKLLAGPIDPRKYQLVEEGVAPLPDTPELRKIYKEIGDVIDQNEDRTARWLKRQVKKGKGVPVASKESSAMALLHEHPDWSDTKIAEKVGVYRTSMYRWKSYKELRAWLKEKAKKTAKIPRGFKKTNRDVEAVARKPSNRN